MSLITIIIVVIVFLLNISQKSSKCIILFDATSYGQHTESRKLRAQSL